MHLFVGFSSSSSSSTAAASPSSSSSSSSSSLRVRRRHWRVFVSRRPTCSVHPDAFLFWRRSDLSFPLPAASRRVSRVSGFEIKKTHPLDSGKDDNMSRAKRTDDRWRNYRRHPEPRKTSNTIIHPEARWKMRLVVTFLSGHFSFRFIAFSYPRKEYSLHRVLNVFLSLWYRETSPMALPFGLLGASCR